MDFSKVFLHYWYQRIGRSHEDLTARSRYKQTSEERHAFVVPLFYYIYNKRQSMSLNRLGEQYS